jgi:hypothetical protein
MSLRLPWLRMLICVSLEEILLRNRFLSRKECSIGEMCTILEKREGPQLFHEGPKRGRQFNLHKKFRFTMRKPFE